jgi:uncharacterized repeat protein (TIGR01451 family)
VALTPRMPAEAAGRAATLIIDGRERVLADGEPVLLPARPGARIAIGLPLDDPLSLEPPSVGFADPATLPDRCLLRPEIGDFLPGPPDADGAPVGVAGVELTLIPAKRAPRLALSPQGLVIRSGESLRQEMILANESLSPLPVELRYLPDPARFASGNAEAVGCDRRLADGTLCWLRTLPAAAWEPGGAVIPSTLTVTLELTALPLPADAGFADARDAWQLRWSGQSRRGVWSAQIVAPRIQASLSADVEQARPGERIRFSARLINRGGAGKRVIFSTVLPGGFRYQPTRDEPAPEIVGDMLLWTLDAPAADRAEAGGQPTPAEAELRYTLLMEDDALGENQGWRAMDFIGWLDGARLAPARVTLLAPRIRARQELSAAEALAGDTITLRTVFENAGGADGLVVWTQALPDGLTYVPEPENRLPPTIDAQGRLVWRVEVPASAQASGGIAGPGVAERTLTLRLGETPGGEHAGGRWPLPLTATVDLQSLPALTLDALCPDVTVQALAERAEVAPGGLCVITLRATNRGPAGAALTLEAEIPDGFEPTADTAALPGPKAVRKGRTLAWKLEVPAAQAERAAVVEVRYPLRAAPLAQGERARSVLHGARFSVAGGPAREALSTRVEVVRQGVFAALPDGFWIFAPLTVLLLGVAAVFVLLLRRGRDEG